MGNFNNDGFQYETDTATNSQAVANNEVENIPALSQKLPNLYQKN